MSRQGLLEVRDSRGVTVMANGRVVVFGVPAEEGVGNGGGGGGATGGSLLFDPTASATLTAPGSVDWAFGTGDFTVEWWQYQTDSSPFPRIFSVGSFPSSAIGVSIEGGTFYVWVGGSANNFGTATPQKNAWVHFAVTRSGTSLRVFKNGTQLGSTRTNSTNISNSSSVLSIGSEGTNGSYFGGNLTNFHVIKGTAKQTSSFTPPTTPISSDANSRLLLLATDAGTFLDDSSGEGKTITNVGDAVTFSADTPQT